MAQDELIAARYARGLAELAAEENGMDRARRDLKLVADLLDSRAGDRFVPEFLDFLSAPGVPPADKQRAAERILSDIGVGVMVRNFLGVLIERNRVDLMPRISREFAGMAGELARERTALVRTARPLSEEQAERLSAALSAAFGGAVRLHQEVEPGLLAGARVTVGDKTFDGSVQGRLDVLRHRLAAKGWEALEAKEHDNAE